MPYLADCLNDGRNRGDTITEFEKEKDQGFFWGLANGRIVIEVYVIEGFYCRFLFYKKKG